MLQALESPHGLPLQDQGDNLLLSSEQAQVLVRMLETAHVVHRRFQFFVWIQSQLQTLVPHQLMVCGAYQRHSRSVVFDTFQNVVMSQEVLACMVDPDGSLTRALSEAWVAGRGRPVLVKLAGIFGAAASGVHLLQRELGYQELLVHGVARPQRPEEIESLFIFGGPPEAEGSARRVACLDLVLPQLHRVWQRVITNEHELARPTANPAGALALPNGDSQRNCRALTTRERQILQWVRDGSSNQQVADALSISPLTVKNHIQKILRKLGANNRAQAVARAMSDGLIDGAAVDDKRNRERTAAPN
jgi:transcriptional regulator EpsA